jgi:hypothetical protein
MVSASLVMTGPFGAGGALGGLFAPPEPPPHALKAIAATVIQIARRMAKTAFLPRKSTHWSILAA